MGWDGLVGFGLGIMGGLERRGGRGVDSCDML